MCLAFFLVDTVPNTPLLILFNRDEKRFRPTAPLYTWKEFNITAGRDLERTGTWAGVTPEGRFGCLTSEVVSGLRGRSPRSRGKLVTDFLERKSTGVEYLEQVKRDIDFYTGFNLVVGDRDGLYHLSTLSQKITKLCPGIHGVSNADLNTPWPKVEFGKKRLEELKSQNLLTEDNCFEFMSKNDPVGEIDRSLKWPYADRLYIAGETYGTRASSYLRFSADKTILFTELTFDNEENIKTRRSMII